MYGQRNIPFILDLAKDNKQHTKPTCLLMNYANPMAMNVWAAHHYGQVRVVELCHGVQAGHRLIAHVLGIPVNDLEYVCAGINHQTWFTELVYQGREMTGDLLEALERSEFAGLEQVRIDMLRRFGYFSTESNGHLSEYLPWYRKRVDEIGRWIGEDVGKVESAVAQAASDISTREHINRGETGGARRQNLEWQN